MDKHKKGEEFDVSVKLSGAALEKVMHVRNEREKGTGRITSIAGLVKEAIDYWYNSEKTTDAKV